MGQSEGEEVHPNAPSRRTHSGEIKHKESAITKSNNKKNASV